MLSRKKSRTTTTYLEVEQLNIKSVALLEQGDVRERLKSLESKIDKIEHELIEVHSLVNKEEDCD